MAEAGILDDEITPSTDEFQYRYVCLKMSHMVAEATGAWDKDVIVDRALEYWHFILGSNPDAVLAAVRKSLEETKGYA